MKKSLVLLLCIIIIMPIAAKGYVSLGGAYMKSGAVYDTSTVASFQLEGKENVVSFDASFRWIPFSHFGFYVDCDFGFILDKDIISVVSTLPALRSNQRLGFTFSYDVTERINLLFDVYALEMLHYCKGSYANKPQWTIATFHGAWGFGMGASFSYYVFKNSGFFVSFDWEKVLAGLGVSNVEKNTKEKLEHSKAEAYGSEMKFTLGYMWRI
ncbi:MAG: hypothetical protein ACI4SL_04835 [Candidatus Ornithospirochaeta sp.]